MFDAIFVTSSPIRTMESLLHNARKTLTDAIKVDELHLKEVKDEVWVGNMRGLDLAGLSHHLDTELVALKKKMAEYDLTTCSQKECISYLLHSDDFYKQVRNYYLSTFKRDFLKTHTTID